MLWLVYLIIISIVGVVIYFYCTLDYLKINKSENTKKSDSTFISENVKKRKGVRFAPNVKNVFERRHPYPKTQTKRLFSRNPKIFNQEIRDYKNRIEMARRNRN